jgi:hypothetical protein
LNLLLRGLHVKHGVGREFSTHTHHSTLGKARKTLIELAGRSTLPPDSNLRTEIRLSCRRTPVAALTCAGGRLILSELRVTIHTVPLHCSTYQLLNV